eukprot:scaffold74988_cov57-Phaeocystis_antarctica.AAC.1
MASDGGRGLSGARRKQCAVRSGAHRVVAIGRCPPSDRARDALAAVKQQHLRAQPRVPRILPAFLGQRRERPGWGWG